MNPLSALGSLPMTNLQSLPLQQGKAGVIPQAELKNLSSLTGPGGAPDFEKLGSTLSPGSTSAITGTGGPDLFGNMLGQMVREVNSKGAASSEAVNGLLSGKDVSLHQTMIAVEEASVSFQLMVEVRNKLLESYQELMRMQV